MELRIKDAAILTESVRKSLYRTITQQIKTDDGEVPLYTLWTEE